ncbi:hypothetical protein XENOCAPTIV_025975 [Xenoophorus captivus]|uniref:GON-4-like protein n=1 Tax=Xenoophorus captivus TaxID=1517983 RepID=A0ABV0S9I5_9TELE
MKSGASLRALILTPERIPSFIIPSSCSPFLASPMFRGNSSDRSRLLSEDDDEDQTETSPLGTPTNPGASSRRRLRLRTPRGRRPHHAAADGADADPTTRAALSLPHVPKVTTPYGFRGVLATTPNTSRRESLFHRNRPVKVTVNDAEPDGGPAGTPPAAAGPEGTEDNHKGVKAPRKKAVKKKKRTLNEKEVNEKGQTSETEEETGVEVEIDRELDQALETKSKQHNLTTVNVKNIIHEVITNEHVVAMMKAAINETEAVPPFKWWRRVWLLSLLTSHWMRKTPLTKNTAQMKKRRMRQLKTCGSDLEYVPGERHGEHGFVSQGYSAQSSRGGQLQPLAAFPSRGVTDTAFLEKLHAVEEELAGCMEPYQDESGVMACRTRSKRPLRNVPLGQLEAELRAPDITPDMYDSSSAPEDREWTDWLRGLLSSDVDNEEECDDEDDPEYNFLAEIDEPDQEDYRDDKAVRITSQYRQIPFKQVSCLLDIFTVCDIFPFLL